MAYTAEELVSELEDAGSKNRRKDDKATDKKLEELSRNETIINTNYFVPDIEHKPILDKMKEIFTELTSAIEEFAKDYEEENTIKEFLQKKWAHRFSSTSTTSVSKKPVLC